MHVALKSIDGFQIEEFLGRWRGARQAALNSLNINGQERPLSNDWEIEAEATAIAALDEEEFDRALRVVFDYSRQFALSAAKRFRIQFDLDDFQSILSVSKIPCTTAHWSQRESARVAERTGCPLLHVNGIHQVCQWFREAADGLVMGLGSTERYVRHRSEAFGDDSCMDIIYEEVGEKSDPLLRWGPVPAPISTSLNGVVSDFARLGDTVAWTGYSAGTLFYQLNAGSIKPLCGTKARIKHSELFAKVHEVFPELRMQDAAPLAVYAEGTQ